MVIDDIVKVIVPATLAFLLGIAGTPILTHYLYKYQAWKKKPGKLGGYGDNTGTPIFNKLHESREMNTPRMGGIVIWGSVLGAVALIWLIARYFPGDLTSKLEFLSRDQTWLPLLALIIGGVVGFIDDMLEVTGKGKYFAGGLSLRWRLMVVAFVSLFAAWWFYDKLDVMSVAIPFGGELMLGALFVPFFIAVMLAIYAGGVIDGIDGLAGGVFAAIFSAYAGIAFYQDQINLAAFCAAIVGGLLAFLWFNIPPARFYMSETGVMGLTMALGVVAFLTDTLGEGNGVAVLPIIAFPLVVTVGSDVIQVLSKKIRGKKVFHIAPIHHHFEALGWPPYKVTMRYWVVSVICALFGVIIALAG